jgi:GT2 family glycosyltransferase
VISIVIPNYNGSKYIKDCINSIYKQTYKEYEIIVVDNDSKDDSVEIIEKSFKNIKLIKNINNLGFSAAVNQGIKASTGELVILLNNDTVVFEDWLQNLVKCINKDKRIFSVCSKMIRYNEKDKIDDAGDEYCILGWAYKRGDGQPIQKYSKDEEVFSSCAGAGIYRKKVFDEIGYFDENFFAYMEDVDISYRAKIHGYKNIYCADAKVFHIGSATSGSKYNSFKIKLAARNNVYVVYKNMLLLQLIINFPFLFTGFLIKYLFFIKKGHKKEYEEGIKEAFSNIRKMKKVKFQFNNLKNYILIEFYMIINTVKYIFFKLFK